MHFGGKELGTKFPAKTKLRPFWLESGLEYFDEFPGIGGLLLVNSMYELLEA